MFNRHTNVEIRKDKHSNVHWSMVLQGETLDYWLGHSRWASGSNRNSGRNEELAQESTDVAA